MGGEGAATHSSSSAHTANQREVFPSKSASCGWMVRVWPSAMNWRKIVEWIFTQSAQPAARPVAKYCLWFEDELDAWCRLEQKLLWNSMSVCVCVCVLFRVFLGIWVAFSVFQYLTVVQKVVSCEFEWLRSVMGSYA